MPAGRSSRSASHSSSQREALRRQREFAADASHELRTPLTVIRASVDDLERHPKQPVANVGSALTDIRDEVDHLTAMVDDLLLLARSDSGAIELERVPTRSWRCRVVRGLGADHGWRRTAACSSSSTRYRPRSPATPLGSGSSSGSSSTTPSATRRTGAGSTSASGPTARNAVLVVEDEGPGIRPEDLPRVFDRFYRAAGAPGGGTGLGSGDRGLDRRAARRPDRGREPRADRGAASRSGCRCSSVLPGLAA